jgi:hypothetical protein
MASVSNLLASSAVFVGFSIAALAATLVVGIGLYLEYERYEDRAKRIGNLLVVGGVILEALFGLVAFTSATVRESRNELQIVALTVRANQLAKDTTTARTQIVAAQERIANAERDSAGANAHAKEADKRIAELKKEAEVARKQIAEAEARADAAKAQIAKSDEKAEAERLARVKLQEAIAWRTLTVEQSQDITTALKPFAGERVNLLASPYEADASSFAGDLFCALSTCWKDLATGASNERIKASGWWPGNVVPKTWVPMDNAGWLASMEDEREVGFSSWRASARLHAVHGITVVMSPNATPRDLMAARALVCALWAQHFDVSEIQLSLDLSVSWSSPLDSKARIAVFVESRMPPDMKISEEPSCGQTGKGQ